ncbi:MAG: hypothetical protein NTW85_16935 [Methylococcales bacterium]|nr:hypothetical protein [Methylococcales bacterium]
MNEIITNLVFSIPPGIVSGLYAGIVVARYQRFADLRLQAKKLILEIEFINHGNKIIFPKRKGIPEFDIIVSDLLFLRHKKAAETILQLSVDIRSAITRAEAGQIDINSFNNDYLSWQVSIRSISPSPLQVLRLWGGL